MRRFRATARLRALDLLLKSFNHPNYLDVLRGTAVATRAAQSRSVAVIGRKRSAQDSWDDACTPETHVVSGSEQSNRTGSTPDLKNPKSYQGE